jgi:hypothetical protein
MLVLESFRVKPLTRVNEDWRAGESALQAGL